MYNGLSTANKLVCSSYAGQGVVHKYQTPFLEVLNLSELKPLFGPPQPQTIM